MRDQLVWKTFTSNSIGRSTFIILIHFILSRINQQYIIIFVQVVIPDNYMHRFVFSGLDYRQSEGELPVLRESLEGDEAHHSSPPSTAKDLSVASAITSVGSLSLCADGTQPVLSLRGEISEATQAESNFSLTGPSSETASTEAGQQISEIQSQSFSTLLS
jgi:hypothetical protein